MSLDLPTKSNPEVQSARPLDSRWTDNDRVLWAVTVALLALLYAIVHNPYWVPGGDSEVYLATARNLAQGEGYVFNGHPVGMIPPGWPIVLAAAMTLTDSFALLKLVPMLSMLGFWAVAYWIVRRLATPRQAALTVVTGGLLSHVVPLTYWFHSDALFALVSGAAILVAFQINENRPAGWRIPLLILLCLAAVTVRWTGLLTWLLVAAALIHGQLRPRLNPQWIALLLLGLVSVGSFFAVRSVMESRLAAREAEVARTDADRSVTRMYDVLVMDLGPREYRDRAINAGQWFSWLFWQPLRVGQASPTADRAVTAVGWLLIIPLAITALRGALRREWIWLAVMIYAIALCLRWAAPNARYFVPIAFLLIPGIIQGIDWLRMRFANRWWRGIGSAGIALFVGSVLLCNVVLYAVDARVARAGDFYETYEAGLNKDLIAAAHWLNQQSPEDGEIAVSRRYSNLGRTRTSHFGLRALNALTDRAIQTVPPQLSRPPNRHVIEWAEQQNVRYYLYQPPISPWRVWHFRLPWLQERLTGEPAIEHDSTWRLYRIQDGRAERITPPEIHDWPRRVPMLRSRPEGTDGSDVR